MFGIDGASMVAAPTEAMLSALRRHHTVRVPTRVIPNGRSPELFRPTQKEPLVLSAGRLWDDAKNATAVERVSCDICWPTAIAGMEAEPGSSRAKKDGGFVGALRLGRVDEADLAAWMGRAAIFALPARYEPFGLAPLEAALAGCALVLGDIDSLHEVWGDAALFVPCDDDEVLAETLNAVIHDSMLRATMAARARQRAMEFRPGRMAAAYRSTYVELAAMGRAPAGEASRCA